MPRVETPPLPEERKEDHVRLCLGDGVEGPGDTGLGHVGLLTSPAPLKPDQVDLGSELLGYGLNLPS